MWRHQSAALPQHDKQGFLPLSLPDTSQHQYPEEPAGVGFILHSTLLNSPALPRQWWDSRVLSEEWEGAQLRHSCCGLPKPCGATEVSRSLPCQGSCAAAADRAAAQRGWLLILETDFLVHVMTLLL